jgi:hypothetical protein
LDFRPIIKQATALHLFEPFPQLHPIYHIVKKTEPISQTAAHKAPNGQTDFGLIEMEASL